MQGMRGGQGAGQGRGQGQGAVQGGGRGMGGTAQGQGRGRGGGTGQGLGGQCVCPKCGHKEPHQRGAQCFNLKCPKCNVPLAREG